MFASIARAVFGTSNDRSLKAYQRRVPKINAHEAAITALDDAALRAYLLRRAGSVESSDGES